VSLNETVLVTGASGLIGSHLVDALLIGGKRVIGLSRSYPLQILGLKQFSDDRYIPVVGDVCDANQLKNLLSQYRPHRIVHLAAQAIVGNATKETEATFETNITGTWRLLEALRHYGDAQRIVIASSDKAYGSGSHLPYSEATPLKAVYPYDVSKMAAESLAMSYFHTYGLPITITRCGNTYGPYDLNASRIVPGAIRACLRSEPVVLRSDGKSERCYIYVKDVVNAYCLLLEAKSEVVVGQAFNVGNSVPVSVLHLVDAIYRVAGRPKLAPIIQANAQHEIDKQTLRCSKLQTLLAWKEEFDLVSGLRETLEWYSNFNELLPWQE
jgi:CDP-glucose 4,6-dehydratase